MLDGRSLFLTGPPGAGKTFILNEFIRRARAQGKTVAVTASTGIAATHIGGVTIHSWSGLGIKDFIDARTRQQLAGNAKLSKRYNSTDILVIDEVSMLHGHRLDLVNEVCKLLRKSERPFGGLQVILVGDLFQLPPVDRGNGQPDFVHLSAAWDELQPNICYLSEQHRQQNDGLLDLLEAMRRGELQDYHEDLLKTRLGIKPAEGQIITRLYAHNVDIDTVNQRHLMALQDQMYDYEMETKGAAVKIEQLQRSVLAPELLEIKAGAEVMFVANNPGAGFVNGTRGQVVDFDDNKPIVRLHGSSRKIKVEPHSWKLEEDGKIRAEVSQLPLRLAWAITIHKSQGMSLDAAEIDLSKTFTPGMGYVALSRVRSLDGLYLNGINAMAVRLHPAIYDLDREMKGLSAALAAITKDAEDEQEETPEEKAINIEILELLKTWRSERSRADAVPAYIVAHDSLLEAIATRRPQTEGQLLSISGMGPAKLAKYGPEILRVTIS